MKERIQEYMTYKSIHAGELAAKLDVQRSNISHILNGRNKPSATFIERMLTEFPDLNARWLLTGEGEMTEVHSDKESSFAGKESTVQRNERSNIPKKEEELLQFALPLSSPKEEKLNVEKADSLEVTENSEPVEVESIVIFYSDGTFSSYKKRKGHF